MSASEVSVTAAVKPTGARARTVRTERVGAVALAGVLAASHLEAAVQAVRSSVSLAAVLLCLALAFAAGAGAIARCAEGRLRLRATALLAAGLAGTWAFSRTAGFPGAGGPSAVGILDSVTVAGEVTLAVLCLALSGGHVRLAAAMSGPSYAAVAATCIALSVGCKIGADPAAAAWGAPSRGGAAAHGRTLPLLCHLY